VFLFSLFFSAAARLATGVIGHREGHNTVLYGREISVGDFHVIFHEILAYNKNHFAK
jgi:hypothetical protein